MRIKGNLIGNMLNMKGFKTSRKIIVFESDDWGSIRMPSTAAYHNLLSSGIRVDQSSYDRLDSLENKSDFTNLLEVLSSLKCHNEQPVVFTLNTIMANPDFEKIRKNNYSIYHYELFYDSYCKYYGQDLKPLWTDGISAGLIKPQFHAREHMNTSLWMNDLRLGHLKTRIAFEQGFFGLKTETSSVLQNHYLAAYWSENPDDLKQKLLVCKEGLDLFKSAFGFHSQSMIACNYIWPVEMEAEFQRYGIHYLQGQRAQVAASETGSKCKSIYHYTGQRNQQGQRYLVRNCLFEPYADVQRDWVNSCLKEISNSFFWNTPAIVSTHRINYSSNMDLRNRDNNLSMLKSLLLRILKKWPEVEFMSSDSLGELIEKK